ncbi:pyruvate kinase [Patulibacter brassicae]|uniref:Pyruvate kinase n=1 Tax=Patulibacter brassicae TaxID=1705717 RepID=A0ABU4VN71_9ACTN|nr:pyruvate kinase [Patulibacter brassicae]MDX8152524.1 pyruvate kinase [Patulibacter brassicae]
MSPAPRRTKIVATIGPASRDPDVLVRMIHAGMDVARLNFSHGSHEDHAETVRLVREAAERAGRPVAILQDLPGPKIRLGQVEPEVVDLREGDLVTLRSGNVEDVGDERSLVVAWDRFADAVEPGEEVHLADGIVRLKVEAVRTGEGEADCRVELGGPVSSRKGVNLSGPADLLPAVPEEDLAHVAAGRQMGVDLVAVSFVRRPEDIELLRSKTRCPLIAKFEKPQAIENAEAIVRAADCIMVARGDLGIELPIARVPRVQKELIAMAGALARPAITATQMLESMVHSARPTRAEVTDVANAILDGTDAVMLSQESAVGRYPVEAVRTLAEVAVETEAVAPTWDWNQRRVRRDSADPSWAVARSAVAVAQELDAAAIVVPTLSGRSARLVSAHRPDRRVIALSPSRETVARCNLMWGVEGAMMAHHGITEELIADAAARVRELGWCRPGDRVVITAGLPSGTPGTTSLVQVQTI